MNLAFATPGNSSAATMTEPTPAPATRKAVGIDLGTTFCAVAHIDAYGKPQIIPNAESERITPSVILFDGTSAIVSTAVRPAVCSVSA